MSFLAVASSSCGEVRSGRMTKVSKPREGRIRAPAGPLGAKQLRKQASYNCLFPLGRGSGGGATATGNLTSGHHSA